MSRKLSLIPIGIIVIVGAVWAAGSIFPDNPGAGFGARPSIPGTLAHVLDTYFRPDGTALDSNALGGLDASGYLKGVNCGFGEVWRAIDATTGTAVCMGPPLAFAEIMSGSLVVNGTLRNPGHVIKEGDRIVTDATQSGTIRFYDVPGVTPSTAGISLARIGTGSSIYITRGDNAGTLALVELEEGLLWGRVLTSTGISFGGGGIVAGIRGTSIAMEKVTGQTLVRMVIPHSQRTGSTLSDAAATIKKSAGGTSTLGVLQTLEFYIGDTVPTPSTQTLQQLYTTWQPARLSPWIARNTLLDLNYMIGLGGPVGGYVDKEIIATEPVKGSNDDPCRNQGKVWLDRTHQCVFAYADESTNYDLRWASGDWEILAMKKILTGSIASDNGNLNNDNFLTGVITGTTTGAGFDGSKRYTPLSQAFGGNNPWYTGSCPNRWNPFCTTIINALADGYKGILITKPSDSSSYTSAELIDGFYWNKWESPQLDAIQSNDETVRFVNLNQPHTNSLNINETGKYLTFVGNGQTALGYLQTGSGGNYSSLAGKTVTIELGGAVGSNLSTGWTKAYIADFGSEKWFISNGKNCAGVTISGKALCKVGVTDESPTYADSLEISLPISNPPTQMIIGNNSTDRLNPIGTNIQKIIIQ